MLLDRRIIYSRSPRPCQIYCFISTQPLLLPTILPLLPNTREPSKALAASFYIPRLDLHYQP